MKYMNSFFKEIVSFSKNNWWVYIVYLIMLFILGSTQTADIKVVIMTTSLHFVADIFIMMMFSAYSAKQFNDGAYFQIISMLILLSVKIFTGYFSQEWHYLAADPIYALAALKNWSLDVKRIDIKSVNLTTMSALSFLILFGIIVPLGIVSFKNPAQLVQTSGIFLFAIALATTGNERLRYALSILALSAMVVGSAWDVLNNLQHHAPNKTGLALSYTLLPFTVLVFYFKQWNKIR